MFTEERNREMKGNEVVTDTNYYRKSEDRIIRSTSKGFEEMSGDTAEVSKKAFSMYFNKEYVDTDAVE